MKFLGCILILISNFAYANDLTNGQESLSESKFNASTLRANKNAMKAGLHFHGFNSGTAYISISTARDFGRKLTLGLQGMIPIDQDEAIQLYIGKVFAQLNLLNTSQRRIFWDFSAALTAADNTLFNSGSNLIFGGGLGSSVGFTHKIKLQDQTDLGLTASAGVDYLGVSIDGNGTNSRPGFYSNFGFSASYFF